MEITTTTVTVTFLPHSYTWGRLPRVIRHLLEEEAIRRVRRAVNRFLYEG